MGDQDLPESSTGEDRGIKGSKMEYRDILMSTKSGSQVQKIKVLKKYEMEIQLKDGIGSVSVPDEVFEDAAPLWEDFLIGRFLEKAPHIAKVHAIVNKIWALSDKAQMIDVYQINSTTMKFKVSNPITRNRIIKRAMWNIAEIPVVMANWSPLTEDIRQETHSIPLWVHLRNVPMDMFTWKGLSFVSSPIGTPVRLHPETEQCLNLKVAKIFVKVDLSKEMPKSMNFNFHGKETLVEYIYPWLPAKCTCCGKWGHLVQVCRGKEVIETKESVEGNVEDIREKSVGGSDERVTISEDKAETESVAEKGNGITDKEVGMLVGESGDKDEDMEKISEHGVSVERQEKAWEKISPGKASRTPTKLQFGQVPIMSKSRFSVLSTEEEEGEIKENRESSEAESSDEDKHLEEDKELENTVL